MQVACEFNFGPWQLNINSVERETQIELRSSFFFVGGGDLIQFQALPQNIFLYIYFNCLKKQHRKVTHIYQCYRICESMTTFIYFF